MQSNTITIKDYMGHPYYTDKFGLYITTDNPAGNKRIIFEVCEIIADEIPFWTDTEKDKFKKKVCEWFIAAIEEKLAKNEPETNKIYKHGI